MFTTSCFSRSELTDLYSASPLEAAPIHAFTELISETRTVNGHSGAAKARAYELFVQLYEQGDQKVHDFLSEFADQLGSIMHKWYVFPHLKDRRTLLFLAEINHLLKEIITDYNKRNNRPIRVNPDEFTRELYTALNGTFGDNWRRVALIMGAGASLFVIYLLAKLGSAAYKVATAAKETSTAVTYFTQTLKEVNEGEGELGYVFKKNREHTEAELKAGRTPEGIVTQFSKLSNAVVESELLAPLTTILKRTADNPDDQTMTDFIKAMTKQIS